MKKLLIVLLFNLVIVSAFSQEVFTKSGDAIQGYDPVAYFKENKPVKGEDQFTYTWRGAKWKFSNADNLVAFKSDPEKFAPQFGGYCAYGMADGHKAPTSADAWAIVDDKLYLNYNTDVRVMWKEKQQQNILKAKKNWPSVKKQKD
jgi:hypothetical protein